MRDCMRVPLFGHPAIPDTGATTQRQRQKGAQAGHVRAVLYSAVRDGRVGGAGVLCACRAPVRSQAPVCTPELARQAHRAAANGEDSGGRGGKRVFWNCTRHPGALVSSEQPVRAPRLPAVCSLL